MPKKNTNGFCRICQKNVPHRRWIGNPIALMFDLLTLRITRFLRVGPWYCVHCDNKVVMLSLRNRDALDYRSAALRNESTPIAAPSKPDASVPVAEPAPVKPAPVKPAAAKAAPAKAAPAAPAKAAPAAAQLEPAESVGNFIKTESSLIKSTRLQRFSEKYRDAVVRRIFSGVSSIKQVREEKQLSETEITDWIADLFQRQQQKIDALERFKDSITAAAQLEKPSFEDVNSDAQTVAGQVRPR